MRYLADDLSGPLPHGSVESKALAYDSDAMAMTETQRQAVFGQLTGAPTNEELEGEGKYVFDEGAWWVRTGHPTYDASKFYAVTSVEDPYGNVYSTTHDAHELLVVSSTDPLGNVVTAEHDYRVLGPWQITDPNGNRSQVAFDVLGLVVKSAVLGKVGDDDGDTLDDPTSTFEYDLFAWQTTGKPNWSRSRMRETHRDPDTRWLEQRTYFSGSGGAVMVKVQARPGFAPQRDQVGQLVLDQNGKPVLADTSPHLRWIGNGRVVKDNKGNVVKAYEPYYSSTPEFEDEAELVEQGVTAINHYDPLGRLIQTDLPNGTFSRVAFTPWEQTSWDVNDTVLESAWYAARINYKGGDIPLQKERRAAQLAAAHANTPSKVHLDTLGRPFLAVAHNRNEQGDDEFYTTRSVLDIQGRVLKVIDARGNTAEERVYGMLGQSLKVISVDAGNRWHLTNALGQPMRSWDSRDQRFSFTYDALRRSVDRTVSVGGGPEKLLGRIVYGELLDNAGATNHRGRVYRGYDGAGVATTHAFDFRGHALLEQRQLVADQKSQPDWSALLGHSTIPEMAVAAAPLLDTETFSASSSRDALGRVLTAISPDNSAVSYTYDEGGALQRVDLEHRGSQSTQTVVGEITYNARGQRERVVYGPANSPTTTTTYAYDPQTFRLTRLSTIRESDGAALQGLHYHHDPAGNITDIRDTAQQTVYFQNAVIEAANSYTYDPLYRLIEATGREHASQGTAQRTHEQLPIGPQPMASDPSAMRRYRQLYDYDPVGNILRMQHIPAEADGWTRHYQYAEHGNRLLATSAPGDGPNGPYTHTYNYDAHGSMTAMPHLSTMVWNHDEHLQEVEVGTEAVYFQYAGGMRSRKYVEKSGATTEERIYLGPWEIYRKRISGDLDLERESLHISDGTGRICIIETKTVEDEDPIGTPTPIWRYQLSNHLGSAATEVTQTGDIISHEEYHPYGTSAYRAMDSGIDVSSKRYRYTGMERDEETGLGYHSARYYANWLGRWTTSDPIGIGDGPNRYAYAGMRPTTSRDLTGRTEGIIADALNLWVRPDPQKQQAIRDAIHPKQETAKAESPDAPAIINSDPEPAKPNRTSTAPSTGYHNGYPLPEIEPKYTRFEGIFDQTYDTAVNEAMDPDNPIWGRALMGAGALATAIPMVVETGGEAILNVPYNADLAGQYLARAMLQEDPEKTVGDFGAAFIHSTEAFLGAGTIPAMAMSLKPRPEEINLDTGVAVALVSEGSPVRHTIKSQLAGQPMVMTRTAREEFEQITTHFAGPQERARAARLLDRVRTIPDAPSPRALGLDVTKSVGSNDIRIFGTGDQLRLKTFTTDAKFIRGSQAQGVTFDVTLVPPVPLRGL